MRIVACNFPFSSNCVDCRVFYFLKLSDHIKRSDHLTAIPQIRLLARLDYCSSSFFFQALLNNKNEIIESCYDSLTTASQHETVPPIATACVCGFISIRVLQPYKGYLNFKPLFKIKPACISIRVKLDTLILVRKGFNIVCVLLQRASSLS